MCSYYTQKDFENIINKGVNFSIPQEIIHLIRELDNTTKYKVAQQTKHYEAKHNHIAKQQQIQQQKDAINTNWKPQQQEQNNQNNTQEQSTFQVRKIQPKEGRDKIVQQIKINLNKLSKSNYNTLQPTILQLLQELYDEDQQQQPTHTDEPTPITNPLFYCTAVELFHIMSRHTDMNLASLYTDLFSTILATADNVANIFQTILSAAIVQWKQDMMDIAEPVEDEMSDAFCLWKKQINERRGKTVFWIQLYTKQPAITHATTQATELFNLLLQNVEQTLNQPTTSAKNKALVEELTENIFLFIVGGRQLVLDETAIEQIKLFSNTKLPNMTNRAKFKFKDILDGRGC